MDAAKKRELQAAVTALPGRDGRSGGGPVAPRGVPRGQGLGAEGLTSYARIRLY